MRREDFPPLRNGLVYLDSACMALRPEAVVEKVEEYYRDYPACSGRSHHEMSKRASQELEGARNSVAEFIDAEAGDIVFTSGTTESINTVARGFSRGKVILTDREHNSNLVPWQREDDDIRLVSTQDGFDLEKLRSTVEEGDLVSVVHVSNLDGFETPLGEIAEIVRGKGAYLMVDAAQSVPHRSFSVEEHPVDFVAFSGHKMLGPSGTGALYVEDRVKDDIEPLVSGGGAVSSSTYSTHEFRDFPHRMEAGLPNLAGFIGLGEAARYLEDIGMEQVERHERELTEKIRTGLEEVEGVNPILSEGPGIVSFRIDGMAPHQTALLLDRKDIAVRSGMHCVHSWFADRGQDALVRASLHLYNDEGDVARLVDAVKEIASIA